MRPHCPAASKKQVKCHNEILWALNTNYNVTLYERNFNHLLFLFILIRNEIRFLKRKGVAMAMNLSFADTSAKVIILLTLLTRVLSGGTLSAIQVIVIDI